jgi:uncharacterized protein (TIGR03435 family)
VIRTSYKVIRTGCLAALASFAVNAQPAFEAASVKASVADLSERIDPGRLMLSGMTPNQLIAEAYSLRSFQFSGGPEWLDSDRFDVQATAPGSNSRERLLKMLQTLLADRFKLRIHRETRNLSGYSLLAEKSVKLQHSDATQGRLYVAPLTTDDRRSVNVHFRNATMASLARYMSSMMNCPVLDKTGLTGSFDFEKEVTLDASFSFQDGFQEGFRALAPLLGLKLEPVKVPTEILIIDSAERPSGN